jgi:hypothetical protein
MKGVLPWLVHWACHAGTRDFCSALAALVGPVQNNFFFTVHYFNAFVPIAQQYFVLGRLEQPRQDKNLLYRHAARHLYSLGNGEIC